MHLRLFSSLAYGSLSFALTVAAQTPAASPEPATFPFVVPWDDGAPSATDLSSWLEAPAGKNGFVVAKDGHLSVGGKRVRFFGVNTAFNASFPTHEDAEKMAAHMAKFGIGCVRLHHMDTTPAPVGLLQPDNTTIDPGQLDRLDYFIFALKKHGVYVNINLHVGRKYPGFAEWPGMSGYFKGVDNFDGRMISLQRDFARDLLTHVNPYTKTAYTDEPCVAFVEINNENALFSEFYGKKLDNLPAVHADELRRQWNVWLTAKYGTTEKLRAAWPCDQPLGEIALCKKAESDGYPLEKQRDWIAFLYDTESKYWLGMSRYLKDDLHVKSLIVGTPMGWSPFPIQAQLDVVDCHGYWQHPHFPHKAWDPEDWTVKNLPMAADFKGGLLGSLGQVRVAGKPFICTEYNEAAPNTFDSETMPLLAAYAAMQDWDAVFLFAYSHNLDSMKAGHFRSFFDIAPHPTKMATLPASVAMFVRGDMRAAPLRTIPVPADQVVESIRKNGPTFRASRYGVGLLECLRHPVGLSLSDSPPATPVPDPAPEELPEVTSDTGELHWMLSPEPGKPIRSPVFKRDADGEPVYRPGLVTMDAPKSQGAVGFVGDAPIRLSQTKITVHGGPESFATVNATVMDGADFKTARRILITATGYATNTNLQWKTPEKDSVGKNWGEAPSLVEGISATVELPSLPGAKAWALDERGQRRTPVELATGGNHTTLEIGPRWKTLWYEIEVSATR